MHKRLHYSGPVALAFLVLIAGGFPALHAQDSSANVLIASSSADNAAILPDAPEPLQASTSQQTPPPGSTANAAQGGYVAGKQTKRILGIVPNFRAVSADAKLPPQSAKEKLYGDLEQSFDYSAFIFAGLQAGAGQAQNSYPEFHQGAAGYARYYWHTFADQTDENLWVDFLLPVAFKQDPRYYTLGHGGVLKRAVYSFGRLAITRTDSGNETVNVSEILGAGTAAAISSAYYPSVNRTWTKTGQRWLTNVIIDGATFTFQEFWPDINDHLFHQHD